MYFLHHDSSRILTVSVVIESLYWAFFYVGFLQVPVIYLTLMALGSQSDKSFIPQVTTQQAGNSEIRSACLQWGKQIWLIGSGDFTGREKEKLFAGQREKGGLWSLVLSGYRSLLGLMFNVGKVTVLYLGDLNLRRSEITGRQASFHCVFLFLESCF